MKKCRQVYVKKIPAIGRDFFVDPISPLGASRMTLPAVTLEGIRRMTDRVQGNGSYRCDPG